MVKFHHILHGPVITLYLSPSMIMRTFWSEVKIRLVLRRISFNKDSEGLILDEPDELFFVVIVQ